MKGSTMIENVVLVDAWPKWSGWKNTWVGVDHIGGPEMAFLLEGLGLVEVRRLTFTNWKRPTRSYISERDSVSLTDDGVAHIEHERSRSKKDDASA
jgi:hypothetical protein